MSESKVSVVIPCRNEEKAIAQTVRAILASEHKNLEVLVVDGMSTDATRAIVQGIIDEDPRVKIVDNPRQLTPFAFNLGIKHSTGEFVQIVGSRNVLEPLYIPLLIQALNDNPRVGCVGGDYQHVYDTEDGRAIARAMESKFGVGGGNYRTMTSNAYVDTVGIPMYRRSIFSELGLFDETLTRNQDDEYNFRLRQKGWQILYVHDAKATYLVRASLKKAFKQYQQYGYFKVYVNQKHKAVTTARQLVPAAFLAFWAVAVPGLFVRPGLFVPLTFWVAFAYITGGLILSGQNLTIFERLQVLRACFILHIAYGAGYWVGIWDFIINSEAPRDSMQRMTT